MNRIEIEAIEAQIKRTALTNGPFLSSNGLGYAFYAKSGKAHLIADTGQDRHPKIDYARMWSACQGLAFDTSTQGFGWADLEDLASIDTCKTCMSLLERTNA